MTLGYIFAKLLKKLRGKAILNSSVANTSKVESGSALVNSSMADHSFCGYDCLFINVSIGRFCSIAGRVIVGGARHPMEYVSTSPVFLSHKESINHKFSRHEYGSEAHTNVGHDVWIGEGVFVKGGVTIGTGAVIGMGSVVTKDVPPYAIFAGNPARLIRYRFADDVIEGLLKSEWWLYSDEKLRASAPLFNDPRAFLASLGAS